MDIEKTMILVKGEDKTESIIDFVLGICDGKIQITYSDGRSYLYNEANVVVLENPKSLSLNGRAAYVNGVPVYEPRLILDFKGYIRIIQKSNTFQTIRSDELLLVEDASSSENAQQILTYLREISKYTANDLTEEAFLKQEMDQLTFVHLCGIMFFHYCIQLPQRLFHQCCQQIFLILEEKIQRPCGHSGRFTDIPQGSFHISFFQELPFGTFQKVLPGFFILILRFLF